MQTLLEITGDGSHTLFVPELKEHYHSTFGALQESELVFIRSGFDKIDATQDNLHILEMGFGTGLNAFLTCLESARSSRKVDYLGVEKFPLQPEIINKLNYPDILEPASSGIFKSIHEAPWDLEVMITENFFLQKIKCDIIDLKLNPENFDLVYYDAFGPEVQPELWTDSVFTSIAKAMKTGGILVTYSAKGAVRRALKNSGFDVEKLPGPPGKREITRATKK